VKESAHYNVIIFSPLTKERESAREREKEYNTTARERKALLLLSFSFSLQLAQMIQHLVCLFTLYFFSHLRVISPPHFLPALSQT
jgi:hypothetical protein